MRIALIVLVLAMSGAAQARTIRQLVPTSIAFWTPERGVLASVAYGPSSRLEGQLAVTNDGGRTWNTRWRGGEVWAVAVVPNTDEAWASIPAGNGCLDCPPDLLKSEDGGRSWRRAARGLSIPSFASPQAGYALRSRQADAGPLLRTADGGRTWHRVPSPCKRGWAGHAWSASVSFVSAEHGWLLCTGQPGAGNQAKAIYETTSAGSHWKRLVNVQFEPGNLRAGGLSGFGYPGGISFAPGGRGLLWEGRGPTYLTTNKGRTWKPVSVTSPEIRTGQSGWQVSRRLAYLLVQDSGRRLDYELLRTVNQGRRWRLVHVWDRR
jgi:hypothetical protein